jgi:hypothetical protein
VLSCCLLSLLFEPEDGGKILFLNVEKHLLDQWYRPGVRVPVGVREDILGGT